MHCVPSPLALTTMIAGCGERAHGNMLWLLLYVRPFTQSKRAVDENGAFFASLSPSRVSERVFGTTIEIEWAHDRHGSDIHFRGRGYFYLCMRTVGGGSTERIFAAAAAQQILCRCAFFLLCCSSFVRTLPNSGGINKYTEKLTHTPKTLTDLVVAPIVPQLSDPIKIVHAGHPLVAQILDDVPGCGNGW